MTVVEEARQRRLDTTTVPRLQVVDDRKLSNAERYAAGSRPPPGGLSAFLCKGLT